MPERFFFDTDESSHWYIIPLSRRTEWDKRREDEDDDLSDFRSIGRHPKWYTFENPKEAADA